MLKEWVERMRANKASHDFRRGYCYAAGMLLRRGHVAIQSLEKKSKNDFNTSFDIGISDAIHDYCRIAPRKLKG